MLMLTLFQSLNLLIEMREIDLRRWGVSVKLKRFKWVFIGFEWTVEMAIALVVNAICAEFWEWFLR